jgi:hypothetical protein
MTRRIRRLVILVALVAAMTLGGASAAFGAPNHGKSADAKCGQEQTLWPDDNPAGRWPDPPGQGGTVDPGSNANPDANFGSPQAAYLRCVETA